MCICVAVCTPHSRDENDSVSYLPCVKRGLIFLLFLLGEVFVTRSCPFSCADLSVGASLGPNNPYQVAYRWFDATVIFTGALDILPDTLTSLDVLLCVHRAPGTKDAASLQSLCPWVLASGVAIPESRNVSVSFGGAVGEGAPSGAGPVFSLVLVQGGTVLFVGESSESIEVVDAVSNVRTIGYGGVSGGTVFSGYGGWQIEWDVHAHAAEVLGEVQVVLSLSADTSVFTSVSTTDLSGAPLAPVYLGPVSLLYASPVCLSPSPPFVLSLCFHPGAFLVRRILLGGGHE